MADARSKTKAGDRPLPAASLHGYVEPTRRKDGHRPAARGDDTRNRIIAEAAQCVLDEGFAGTSANRVAQRCGVTWGVIQYHFGDTASLLSAVVEAGYVEFRGIVESAAPVAPAAPETPPSPDHDLRARVRAIVDVGWQAFSTPLGRASIEILVNTRASRAADPAHARHLLEMARGLHRVLGDRFPITDAAEDSSAVRNVVWAALRGFVLAQMMSPSEFDFATERDLLVDLVTTYLEADAARARPPSRPAHRPKGSST